MGDRTMIKKHERVSQLKFIHTSGAVHKLCNAEGGRGGLAKRYYCIFLLFKSIRILTESVTWGEGVKNCTFWRYIIYGWPLICLS